MGKRKQKKIVSGKDVLAMQLGQKFADVVMKALFNYANKLADDNPEGVAAVVINEGAGNFAIVSDDTIEVFDSIKTPVALIKDVAGDGELAWRIWRIFQSHGEKVAKGLVPAILFSNFHGEFIAIDNEESDD
jgi:hypothetical protein